MAFAPLISWNGRLRGPNREECGAGKRQISGPTAEKSRKSSLSSTYFHRSPTGEPSEQRLTCFISPASFRYTALFCRNFLFFLGQRPASDKIMGGHEYSPGGQSFIS